MSKRRKQYAAEKVDPPATANHRSQFRGVAMRAAGVFLGIVLGLIGAEIGLRVMDIRPERYAPPTWLGWDGARFRHLAEFGGWGHGVYKNPSRFEALGVKMGEHIPGTRFRVEYATNPRGYFDENNGITYNINSHGLHGPEVDIKKPEGTFRILGIGDSFTFGQGVKETDTFLRRLEHSLNASSRVAKQVEVLNVGVLGYNTRDEVVYLEHQWLEYDPDLVIISFYLNDAYSDYTFLNNGQGLGVYGLPQGWAKYSFLLDLVRHTYRAKQTQKKLEKYYRQHYFSDARETLEHPGALEVDWTVSRAALSHAVELSRQHGFRVALVIFPEFYHLDDRYPFAEIHELVRDEATALSMPVLDLMTIYRGKVDRELWVHPSDHHPNERAHALAAVAIEQFLWDNDLLQGATTNSDSYSTSDATGEE